MTTINSRVNEALKAQVQQHVQDNRLAYRSVSHFIEVAMIELLKRDQGLAEVR